MDTQQLIDLLKRDKYSKKYFCGVLSIDQIPIRKIKRPCSFIINTQDSSLPGEHWFAIFIPKFGKIEYFDSYGMKPINYQVYDLILMNGKKFLYNKKAIQSSDSENCGKFCIFYIYFRSRNYSMIDIQKFFISNKITNDLFITKFINVIVKKYL